MSAYPNLHDPLALARCLLKRPSVTPEHGGCLDDLEAWLKTLGFHCHRFRHGPQGPHDPHAIHNLYAWRGRSRPRLCFAGHVDVVPAGENWSFPPFSATCVDGKLYGRGAVDMKGAIACFIAALAQTPSSGSIALVITSDEEGPAQYGTKALLEEIAKTWSPKLGQDKTDVRDKTFGFDLTITGEPSNPDYIGQAVKIGRRGSWTAQLEIKGKLEHIAYANSKDNALHRLSKIVTALSSYVWDDADAYFEPTSLNFYAINAKPAVSNITPNVAQASFNVRFNPQQNPETLAKIVKKIIQDTLPENDADDILTTVGCHESYWFPPKRGFTLFQRACHEICHTQIVASTNGGTSDSRFLKNYGEVVDFGLISKTMHQVDEHVSCQDLTLLTAIYRHVIQHFPAAYTRSS